MMLISVPCNVLGLCRKSSSRTPSLGRSSCQVFRGRLHSAGPPPAPWVVAAPPPNMPPSTWDRQKGWETAIRALSERRQSTARASPEHHQSKIRAPPNGCILDHAQNSPKPSSLHTSDSPAKGCPTLFLEIYHPVGFYSNLNKAHFIQQLEQGCPTLRFHSQSVSR